MTSAAALPESATSDVIEQPRVDRIAQLIDLVQRPSSLAVIDQGVVSATNLLTGVILGNLCGDEGYGTYLLAMTIAIIGSGVQCELITNPFTIYGQRRRGHSLARYTGSAFVHQAVSAVVVVLALLACVLAAGQIDKLWVMLPVILVATPFILTREFVRQMSFGRFRFHEALLVDLCVSGMQLVGLFGLWWTGNLTPVTALASLGFACGFTVLVWLIKTWSEVQLSLRHARLHAARNWKFARWTLVAYLVGSTTPFIMPWVLAGFHGEDATGRLGACNSLIGLSYMFVTGVANWLTAKAAREYQTRGEDALRHVLNKTASVLFAVLLPFVGVVWLVGEQLLPLVYGPDFVGLGMVSFVIACGVLANAAGVVSGNGLWAIDRPQDGLKADVATLIVTGVTAVLVVPSYGVLGAAISLACGQLVGAAVRTLTLVFALRREEVQA